MHLSTPGAAVEIGGTVYFDDAGNNAVRRYSDGQITELVGTSHMPGACADGRLSYPHGLASDGTSLYVANGDFTICRIVLGSGALSLLSGGASSYGYMDGSAADARFSAMYGLALDGTTLYVPDFANGVIRTVDTATGSASTLLGQYGTCTETSGPPLSAATICIPTATAVTDGTLYISQQLNVRSYVLSPPGDTIPPAIGEPGSPGSADGIGTQARLRAPSVLVPYKDDDGADALLIADSGNSAIRSFAISSGQVTTIAGSVPHPGIDNGARAASTFSAPYGLAAVGSVIYVADSANAAVRTITNDSVTTLAQGMPFMTPAAVTVENGVAYVADPEANAVFSVVNGTITQLIGGLHAPFGIASSTTKLYVSDGGSNAVLVYGLDGTLQATLDLGLSTTQNVGCATGLGLMNPGNLALDDTTNHLYVAARGNCMVFDVDLATGATTAVAGGARGTGDGIGSGASFDDPFALALDGMGALYVGDYGAATLRRIDLATKAVTTYAGIAGTGGLVTGLRNAARLNRMGGLVALPGGGLIASLPAENVLVLLTQ